ncbi:MAG: hypothetical protein MJ124_09940, partial [Lachnospiraceae bacterium]|nr:hypothetical protein [Lachnospiraceae bacterium]
MGKKTGSFKKKVYGGYEGEKKKKNNVGLKIVGGVLFAAACFVSAFILLEFHDTYWLVALACLILMGTAYFFLNELFSSKEAVIDDLIQAQDALDEVKEEDRQRAEDEFRKSIEEQVSSLDRTSRAMFAAMKKNSDAQEEQMERLQQKLDQLIDEQNAGIKTIVKYNKENARQVAENERGSLEALSGTMAAMAGEFSGVGSEIKEELSKNRAILDNIANHASTVASVSTKAAVLSPNYAPAPSVVMAPMAAVPGIKPDYVTPEILHVEEPVPEPIVAAVEAAMNAEEPVKVEKAEETEPVELVEPIEPIESVDPVDLAEINEPAEVIDSVEEVEPAAEDPLMDGLMSDDDIAALLASADDDDDKSIDEINSEIFGDLVSSAVIEPEPEPEPAPEPAPAPTSEADLAA